MSFDTSPRLSDESVDPLDVIWEQLPYCFLPLDTLISQDKFWEATPHEDNPGSYEFGDVPFEWYEFDSGRS